ncbi:hypothetical protein K458DRAFT_420649 [Lentithecium fluviatile CBS 122367]|uniref:L-ornithine N(5)-monooxygenase [NAD(P)H] n=1 Tax=Lentithecium fluviatile CBS 122367 TaxID=1168545 RepID=A0A6G1IU52_9PLEO|nr:hypothetical protein K458DRAFT_420649 [Lentithecium fluviatile CBS 122367]
MSSTTSSRQSTSRNIWEATLVAINMRTRLIIRERIEMQFAVSSIEKVAGFWIVNGEQQPHQKRLEYRSKRLIVVTGTTSDAKMPALPGSDYFGGQIFHQGDYGRFAVQSQTTPKKVAIIGAGKSAADIVYNQMKAGNEVHWIIRQSGQGPGVFTSPADNAKGPFLNDPELTATRLFGTLSPGCFTERNWWTKLLHGSAVGSKIIDGFFGSAEEKVQKNRRFPPSGRSASRVEQLESGVMKGW